MMGEPIDHLSLRVLILTPTSRDAAVTTSLLQEAGLSCTICDDLYHLARQIDVGAGAVLLTENVVKQDGMLELLAALRRQPSWSELPILVLMRENEHASDSARSVLQVMGNVTLLERPAPMRSVLSAVQAAVRGRQRQYQIRDQIEEIRRNTEDLRESESRFRMMANSISQLAWMARPDGWIYWYNQRWFDYTGATPEQMEGWGWQSVHDPAKLPEVIQQWKESIAEGKKFEMEFPLRGRGGEFRAFLTSAVPIRNDRGEIVHWFGTNTDIEGQRRAAEERQQLLESERAARSEAERASHMKDEFLATLSHELRTPLNAILGWAQILRQGPSDEEDLKEGLQTIERNARAQTQLIEDLLDMSRIISGKVRLEMQQLEAAGFVDAAIETVRPAANAKEIRIERVLDPFAGPILGDPNRLQQVIWNLLTNAIKFTPRGGKVTVIVQRVESHIEINIVDTGAGIRPEFLPHVFERFRQADSSTTRKHGGLGLGLAIVKNLLELHGGAIAVHSDGQGKGSTFTVSLPIAVAYQRPVTDAPATRASTSAAAPFDLTAVHLEGIKVLAVDDEPDARILVKRILEEYGCDVRIAGSALEAMQMLRQYKPDVVISDIGMPELDGYEFIRRIRASAEVNRTPAIALTAFARSEDRTKALRAGFLAHVSKPVEPAELVATVASIARRG